jgi:lysophospholipase L1-like esterase
MPNPKTIPLSCHPDPAPAGEGFSPGSSRGNTAGQRHGVLRSHLFALLVLFVANPAFVSAEVTRWTTYDLVSPESFSAERGYGYEFGTARNPVAGVADPGSAPFYFSIAVDEGNWLVEVELGGPIAGDTTVKAESRRLMLESVKTVPGERVRHQFMVNVRNASVPPPEKNAPGGSAVVLNDREQGSFTWDNKLTLEFGGSAPQVHSVSVAKVHTHTLFLLGDSTVTDQRWEDGASWGQMLTRFFKPGIAVANHAESGETLKSFVTGLRFAKVLSQLKEGDWVLLQFGHNDQKRQWPQTYVEAGTTYRAWLRAYLAEIRLRGATPVLVTSPQRRNFTPDGKIRNTHGDYPAAVRAVAAEEQVALLDLEATSRALYEALGPDRSPLAFSNGGKDATHHNNYGAYQLAKAVAQGIRATPSLAPLAALLTDDFPGYDPAKPDDPATFRLPASPQRSDLRPRGN